MNCPSCHGAMEPLLFQSHLGTPLEIDACWGCQLIWFDSMESTALAPQSVIELFKRIHESRSVPRNIVSARSACPRCATTLTPTHDLARSGSFFYQRCQNCHGRLTSFTQFLREKNFIRSLNPAEVQHLSVSVKQIRCSSCGAPINLETDGACTHCGAAISVLDDKAVQKALDDYADRASREPVVHAFTQIPSTQGSTLRPGNAEIGAWSVRDIAGTTDARVVLIDLVCTGISALFE